MRREQRRQNIIDLSYTISNMILGGFSEHPDPMKAIQHLYTEDEWRSLQEAREEQAEIEAQRAQVAKLMRLGQ